MSSAAPICIAVLAHNEERRIALCLGSLPLGDADTVIHVLVNGSTDQTAAIARKIAASTSNVIVHDWPKGGKARSWNRFVFDELTETHNVHLFCDGDAEICDGALAALTQSLQDNPYANAASALPMNGRSATSYRAAMRREHGLFGDLYALRGDFLKRMRAQNLRLPDDLVGDDGLICALAKTDLGHEDGWDDRRVVVCEGAGFLCEPASLLRPASWRMQYRRMINYSVRHFQNRMISKIMRAPGSVGLPGNLSALYARALADAQPRKSLPFWWFDRLALARMRAQA
jgi:glycosyltransferase involved in cell wall biosynthesis